MSEAKRSWEDIVQEICSLEEDVRELQWRKGELLLEAYALYPGRGFARAMASALGCSARYVEMLMRTAKVFPPETRAADMSWEHHRICACTKDPQGWIDRACAEGWSTRQLREAIRASRDTGPDRQDAMREADILVRRVEEYRAKWGEAGVEGLRRVWLVLSDMIEDGKSRVPESEEAALRKCFEKAAREGLVTYY